MILGAPRAAALVAALLAPLAAFAQVAPRLPARSFDAGALSLQDGGRTVRLHDGDDLQRAVKAAAPGDTLLLDAGAVFRGPIILTRKSGEGWITIRSASPLPAPGRRATLQEGEWMPKIIGSAGPAIAAAAGAAHYRFVNVEVRPREGEFLYVLVELGNNKMPTAELPHDLAFIHCYLHGDALVGGRRGIAMNSGAAAVVDSRVVDFKEQGADSQAIAGWSGTGPFLIANNELDGAGENVLFGGADPPGPDRIPSDIEIRGNLLVKPLSWRQGDPSFSGAVWSVKNLLELKDARRVLIADNVLEHNWAMAQNGFAVLFTVRNQEDTAPYSVVEDVTFERNVVRGSSSAVNILGRDDSHGGRSAQTARIAIRDNRFENISAAHWGGTGTLFQILQGPRDLSIVNNTGLQTGNVIMAEGPPSLGFAFRNNVVMHNEYGITGTGAGVGNTALATYFPGAAVDGNVFIGGEAARYPAGNKFAASVAAVFADPCQAHVREGFAGAGAQTLARLDTAGGSR